MKKFPITDQFLWDLYGVALKPASDLLDFLLSNKYRQIDVLFGNENPVFKKYRDNKKKRGFSNLIYYLKKQNYISVEKLRGKEAAILTEKGREKLIQISLKLKNYTERKRADGKWIMVIFDIPQFERRKRNLLRSVLVNLGYKMFQQSVWVTSLDVSNKTEELLQWYSLEKYVDIFVIEKI